MQAALQKAVNILDRVGVFSRWTNIIGITLLFLMSILNFVDIILDTHWIHTPIRGATEITEVMMIAGIFLAVAHSHNKKGNICVDIFTSKLQSDSRLVLSFITEILGLCMVGLIIINVFCLALYFEQKKMMHAQYLNIPSAPFAVIIAVGCATMWLIMLRDFLKTILKALGAGLWKYQWAIMITVPILFIVLASCWMRRGLWQTDLNVLTVTGIIFFLIMLFSGMPIAFSMMITSIIFIGHIRGYSAAFYLLGTEIYRTAGTYSWAILPFFVLMGFFCYHAGFGEDLYRAAYRWFGHLRGGLAVATVLACTGFAAIVGDSIAATATMGSAAIPQMKKYNYNSQLTAGSIVGGASLGPIIPPSVVFIIVGILTGVSIGKLLVSGILPGLLIAGSYAVLIHFWCYLNPNAGPIGKKSLWKPRFTSLKAGGPVLIIFVLVIGGIYTGLFTPTRGGAIGAVAALILSLLMRRLSWKNFKASLLSTGETVSTTFLLLIGAILLTRFMAWCNLTNTLTVFIKALGLSPSIYVVFTLVAIIIIGCFIGALPLILIGIPIVYPISAALGVNPIWFLLMTVVAVNLGALTPPFGINLFVLRGLQNDMSMATIYKGAVPFCLLTIVDLIIIFFIPQLATWLPGVLK